MLPRPVSLTRRSAGKSHIRGRLLARSNVTNLGILILGSLFTVSLLFNLRSWTLSGYDSISLPHFGTGRSNALSIQTPRSVGNTITRSTQLVKANHLVMVAGHAIWRGCAATSRANESDWVLEEMQKGTKSIDAFYSHIVKGAGLVMEDERAVLVFSGGQTRSSTMETEGQSYLRLAKESALFGSATAAFERATTEEFALDSFQNLLFSIARFREVTGHYPERITAIGFEMKRKRFEELHRSAIRWPASRFRYIGIDLPDGARPNYEGEHQYGYLPYSTDLYGCHDQLLAKRKTRNPFSRFHPYYTSAPELAGLMNWCPEERTELFEGFLPWQR